MANISENIREARLRWLGHVERNTDEDVLMITWKMEAGGHRKIGIPKRRWSDAPTPNRENVEEEGSYTFADPTWMCFLVIVVACTFYWKSTPKSHPAMCFHSVSSSLFLLTQLHERPRLDQ